MKSIVFTLSIVLSFGSFAKTKITWLGQATTLIETSAGKKILIDPFIYNNPKTPKKFKNDDLYKNIDLILITHGHGDHIGDYKKILKLSPKARISMNADMGNVLIGLKQFSKDRYQPLNKSGEFVPFADSTKVIMVRAEHSSSVKVDNEIHYGGEPVGFIIKDNGKTFYHAGDTGVFGDMKMIGSYYKIDLAFVPIGGNYTMGPKEAAYAIDELLKPKMVTPIHYGTFPILKGTSGQFKSYLKDRKRLNVIQPGESITL